MFYCSFEALLIYAHGFEKYYFCTFRGLESTTKMRETPGNGLWMYMYIYIYIYLCVRVNRFV